MITYFYQR